MNDVQPSFVKRLAASRRAFMDAARIRRQEGWMSEARAWVERARACNWDILRARKMLEASEGTR